MVNISKRVYFYTASFLLLMTSQSIYGTEHQSSSSEKRNPLQNSSQAIHFFQDEIDFTTNPHGVKRSIDSQDKTITIVDVRSAKDYAEGHIPGAINIPYDKYNGFHGNETEFKGLRKDGYNVVYCYELLCNLAKEAAIKFASLGYPVKEMQGGFNSWKEKGNPIEK